VRELRGSARLLARYNLVAFVHTSLLLSLL
jgi:hypothetical protein